MALVRSCFNSFMALELFCDQGNFSKISLFEFFFVTLSISNFLHEERVD